MRDFRLGAVVILGLSGCAKLTTESVPVSHGAGGSSGNGGVTSSGAYTGFVGGTSGAGGLAGTGGAGAVVFGDSHPDRPVYSRDCITTRLAGADGGLPKGDPTTVLDASAPLGGDAGVDLKLGAGDLTLLVVFDKSGSMDQGWDERSKWQVANDALMKAIEPVVDNLTIGALFFPQPGDCSVAPLESSLQMSYAPGRRFASHWLETASTRAPNGSTPLELAMVQADLALEQACEHGLLADRFRVVLLTDGEPTCGDDLQAVVQLSAEWHRLGVETWVMGLPGSDAATKLLDAIAHAGGTDKAQMLGTPTALDRGLAAAVK